MLLPPSVRMVFLTSILRPFQFTIIIIIIAISLSTKQILAQSILKDLMMLSPEWAATFDQMDQKALSVQRRSREAFSSADWFLPNKGCSPTCRTGTAVEICSNPPTRRELCALLNNVDWCCRKWAHSKPHAWYFKPNCDVTCVPFSVCPYSTCRRCAEINNNHACCKSKNCVNDNLFAAPDGNALINPDTANQNSARVTTSSSADSALSCPDVPDTICKNHNGNPLKCRLVTGCAYNCVTGICQNAGTIYGQECFNSCSNHCADKCGCLGKLGCTWNAAKGSCTSNMNRFCPLSNFPGNECAHKGAFYSVGGTVCENILQKGDCELDFVLVAANLGSDEAKVGSNSVEYRPEAEIQKEDPEGISRNISFTPGDIKTGSNKDQDIYSTAVVGNVKSCRQEKVQCIHYILPTMSWDGDYELALRMVEGVHSERLKRRFTVRFGGVDVLPDFDILSYKQEQFQPLDVFVNFKVSQKGKMITLKGHKAKQLNATEKLSLCRSACGEDNSFIMSAFHIIKQKKFASRDPCENVKKPVPECDTSSFAHDECERSDGSSTFYAFGGKFCKSTMAGENNDVNCGNVLVIKAVNFYGLSIEDSRGILYEEDLPENVDDANQVKRGRNSLVEAFGYGNPMDRDLYNTLAFVGLEKLQQCEEQCIRYDVQLSGDGKYELAVRTADDESTGQGQRKFNVLLGDIAVFPEVDVFRLTKEMGRAVDLTANFDATNNASRLHLKGYHPSEHSVIELAQNQTVTLSFCTSQCANITYRSWLLGSFSVVKFTNIDSSSDTSNDDMSDGSSIETSSGSSNGVNDRSIIIIDMNVEPNTRGFSIAGTKRNSTCAKYDGNPCGCGFITFCDYNVTSQMCRQRLGTCGPPKGNQCRLRGSLGQNWYSVGGVLCNNLVHNSCPPFVTVMGVNFGRNATAHTDAHGITYVNDAAIPFDISGNMEKREYIRDIGHLQTGFPSSDYPLFSSCMIGWIWEYKFEDSCITYNVTTLGDGMYELAIHSGEPSYNFTTTRNFRIKFNGVLVLTAFDPIHVRFSPNAFSIRVNFKVFEDGTKVKMEGYPVSNLDTVDGKIPLSFCAGLCEWPKIGPNKVNLNPIVSGFSVIKYSKGLPCSEMDGDACGCRYNGGCEFNVQSGQCQSREKVCSLVRATEGECRRGGNHIFYADAGQVCPSLVANGNCSVERTLLAVNFGFEAGFHTDINGINFRSIIGVKFEDLDNSRQIFPAKSPFMTTGFPEEDLPLYNTYEYGASRNVSMPLCVKYPIPTGGDGEYEISIKVGEQLVKYGTLPKHVFSFKLNGRYIVRNFEPIVYAPQPNGMDLNANFRISGNKLAIRGQENTKITTEDASIPFEVCFGDCSWMGVVNYWVLPAFSVVKFKQSETCADYNGDACACRSHTQCQFNVITGQCIETIKVCAATCDSCGECQRGGENIFYVRQGIMCSNLVTHGACQVDKTLLAINFFGNMHTDINGIVYQTEAGVPYDDPYQVMRNGTAYFNKQRAVEGVPLADLALYNTSMFITTFNDFPACVTYQVPTDGNGEYELAVKFAEVWWTNAGVREFSYYFNGQVIVQSLDMAAVRDEPNKGFDLLVNFRIKEDRLKLRGYPESIIATSDKSIPLAFCSGTCDCPWKDKNFQVAAVSVVKFKDVPNPCPEEEEKCIIFFVD